MDQKTADDLIALLKEIMDENVLSVEPGKKGNITIIDPEFNYEFTLDYWFSSMVRNKGSFHLRENKNNISLTRVSLDPNGFHKNADSKIIYGYRLLRYNEEEEEKHPTNNYMRAEPLNERDFPLQDSLIEIFISYLKYNNIQNNDKLIIKNTIY